MRLPSLLAGTGTRLRRLLVEPDYPALAVEVRARAVGAVRLARERRRWSVAAAASLDLPDGALELSMVKPNVLEPEAFRQALKALLERVGAAAGGRVVLVLPDPVARLALVPAADVRGRGRTDLAELIRFRLRRAVPFDVRDSRVAYLAPASPDGPWLVGLIHRPVLDAYEEACRGVGLEPGLVELAGVTLASAAGHAPADRLLVNWDVGYVSFVLVRSGWPMLIRTLTGEAAAEPQHVVQEAMQTVLYHRDRLGGSPLAGAVVRSAALGQDEAVMLLGGPLGLQPESLDVWTGLGVTERLPVAHALAGAAAALHRRVA